MPLHERNTIRDQIDGSLFASAALKEALPKYKFPQHETLPEVALQVIEDELLLDGNARQNLATFCQTWEEPEVHKLMDLAIDKNLIDKDEYPQSAELERRCVHMLADLWNAPDAPNTIGTSSIGSSEACMLAGLAAKWRWRAKREAAGKPTDKPNMVCGPVQVVWHKFARYWDIEMREIPMSPGRYMMDAEQMLPLVDENTMLVVPTFGVTYTGLYEPVLELAEALDRLAGRDRARRRHPCRRGQRRLPGSLLRTGAGVRFPHPPGEVDQHLRSQVRPRPPRGRVGHLAGQSRTARGADLPRLLSGG